MLKEAKLGRDATYGRGSGNEAGRRFTNTNLDAKEMILKALEDNFSELRQTNQYAEALSSIPGIVDQYLANKMQEAVDVAVQLKYDRIREESNTANQQFLDSMTDGMKKNYQETSQKGKSPKLLKKSRIRRKTTTTGSKTHKQSASQSAPVEETMQTTDVFEAPAHQEFVELVSLINQA
ncbi:hypothetical protein Tco_1067050 [Tanacetum coccineum]|uniref:Uncharacterized protein n=1 Tax=Tanacetum coccineum TaxID=301880 RepID=A0ABQ4ZP59_9ASTR